MVLGAYESVPQTKLRGDAPEFVAAHCPALWPSLQLILHQGLLTGLVKSADLLTPPDPDAGSSLGS